MHSSKINSSIAKASGWDEGCGPPMFGGNLLDFILHCTDKNDLSVKSDSDFFTASVCKLDKQTSG